jgi:ribosome production factor 1
MVKHTSGGRPKPKYVAPVDNSTATEKSMKKIPLIKNRIRRAALMLRLKADLKKQRKVE